MELKKYFVKATSSYNTFENPVPAYYFRGSFQSDGRTATLYVAVCGFYELYFNGKRITKGHLSPYISNPNDYVYYDVYSLTPEIGENVVGVLLGNGFQNNPGGYIWDFDKADFRSAPKFALQVTAGGKSVLDSRHFKTAPSPIRSDDYRFGEHYDANFEIEHWNEHGFDDTNWASPLLADPPKGTLQQSDIAPIVEECHLHPVSITPVSNGYIYDFGISNAGVCRLRINGRKGQKIILRHADHLENGDVDLLQIWFRKDPWERDREIVHCDSYTCKGTGDEIYQPTFTYHGFRYVKVEGITPEQATPELLTYIVLHTALNSRGSFTCSDPIANTLQTLTRRSIVSNFHHFPTDCPHREKNGWTADAALTCEAALLNYDPERNYKQWLQNICKAQRPDGSLPGIVPTAGWGFHWGNGPAWDCVLIYLPYFTYVYRGDTTMARESAQAIYRYLHYLRSRTDEQGLLHIGLGDWCPVGQNKPKAPLEVTDTLISMDIAAKASVLFNAIGMTEEALFARNEFAQYRNCARLHLVDPTTQAVSGDCQTSQAMGLYYGLFEPSEEPAAFAQLLKLIHNYNDHIDVGVLGGRVIFHTLSKFNRSDLAYHMITREDYPSYGNWLKRGATTLWENFHPDSVQSMNHHFWGDISAWFIKCIAGIKLNPNENDVNTLLIQPSFICSLTEASANHTAPAGNIKVHWQRRETDIILSTEIPTSIQGTIQLPENFCFSDGSTAKIATTGRYHIFRQKDEA